MPKLDILSYFQGIFLAKNSQSLGEIPAFLKKSKKREMTLGNCVSMPLTSTENLLTIRGWKMASNICHHVRKKVFWASSFLRLKKIIYLRCSLGSLKPLSFDM